MRGKEREEERREENTREERERKCHSQWIVHRFSAAWGGKMGSKLLSCHDGRQVRIFEPPNDAANWPDPFAKVAKHWWEWKAAPILNVTLIVNLILLIDKVLSLSLCVCISDRRGHLCVWAWHPTSALPLVLASAVPTWGWTPIRPELGDHSFDKVMMNILVSFTFLVQVYNDRLCPYRFCLP